MSEAAEAVPTTIGETERPIRGFDAFLAVLTAVTINFGLGIVLGLAIAALWASTKMAGTPAEFLQSDFYAVVGLTTAINAAIVVGLYFVGRRFTRRPFGYFFSAVPAATLVKAAASAVLMMVLYYALERALKFAWHIDLNMAKTEQAMMPKSWSQLFIVLPCFALFVPFYEELLFRGYIFGWLKRVTPLWLAMAISAALFALVHGLFLSRSGVSGWVGTGEIFALGLLLAWWAARTGSLWPAYIVHLVNNAAAFTLAFFLPNWP